jgi:hypothetical protein
MAFMSNLVLHVKSWHSCKIMFNHVKSWHSFKLVSSMLNHVIPVKSCHSCQIMSFMSNHVESCHSCHHSCSLVIQCVIIGILYKVGWGGVGGSKSAFKPSQKQKSTAKRHAHYKWPACNLKSAANRQSISFVFVFYHTGNPYHCPTGHVHQARGPS